MPTDTLSVDCPFCKGPHQYAPSEIMTSGVYLDREASEDDDPRFVGLSNLPPWRYVLCKGTLRHVIVLNDTEG